MRTGSPRRVLGDRLGFAIEALDPRLLLSTTAVTMLGATTADSQSLNVTYEVNATSSPITFAVYRSSTPTFGPGAEQVGSILAAPTLDASGGAASAPGEHSLTLPLPGGLPINPEHPYVLVVADPNPSPSATPDPASVSSFRVASIAIVTHGGLQDNAWKKNGPPWELQMAQSLRAQGYDAVIAFNWVSQSNTPGAAVKQVPRLTAMILDAAKKLPAGEPVDLQFIGHSEGAVINTQTIVQIEAPATADPSIKAGYLDDTLLDPHAANPDFPGTQYSVGGPLGWYAKLSIDNYQARARDPLVFVPKEVDAAQVYYQQSPADRDHNENLHIYNLWGQVPVPGKATYFNLTAEGAVHSGKHGVGVWYEQNIVPTLGNGAPEVARNTLTGRLVSSVGKATYTGTSAPGSTVFLSVAKAGSGPLRVLGQAVTASDGTWTATTRDLAPGRYRVVAEAHPLNWNPKEATQVPTTPLGLLVVG